MKPPTRLPPSHSAHVRPQRACSAHTVLAEQEPTPEKVNLEAANGRRPGQWGRGTQAPAGQQGRPPPRARARGRSPGGLQARAGPRWRRAQSPEPASGRLSPLPAPTLPQPGGAARARARRRQARRRPAPRQRPGRPRARAQAAEAGAFVVGHNSADPALPGEKFCAPHLSGRGASSARPLPPRAARRGSDTRASAGDRAGPSGSSLPPPTPPRGSGGLDRT